VLLPTDVDFTPSLLRKESLVGIAKMLQSEINVVEILDVVDI
jgi:hypothetical protein